MSDTEHTGKSNDHNDPGDDSSLSLDVRAPSLEASPEEGSDQDIGGVVLAWQIEFSSSDNNKSKPKKQLPKALRDREKLYAEKANRNASRKMPPVNSKIANSETRAKGKKSTTPRVHTPSPMKMKSEPEVFASARPSKTNPSRPFSSPAARAQHSSKAVETSSKRSPPIKQPLLAVNPSISSQSPTNTSPSNLSLLLRSPRRVKSATPSLSPRKARDIAPKQGAVLVDKGIQLHSNRNSSSVEKNSGRREQISSAQSQLVTVRIPRVTDVDKQPKPVLATHQQDMEQRKVLDLKRWYCICHPQYSKSCGISSVVSCWNYLFSTLGTGSHRPITQEEALTFLGFKPPFGEISFGPFTGNATCMRWFRQLCNHYRVNGQAYYFYKPVGRGKTFGLRPELALERLKSGLHDPSMAFVYHCLNHYFCPIGYEDVPKMALDAYKVNLTDEDVDTWVLIGEPSRKQASIHCKRWSNIVTDLSTKRPEFFNIRHTERGVQSKKTKRSGGNLHCIMAFKKLDETSGDFFVAPDFSSGPQEPQQSLSEIENLDSSDSDFPLSPNESKLFKIGVNTPDLGDSEAVETIDNFIVELSEKNVGEAVTTPTRDLDYESVNIPQLTSGQPVSHSSASQTTSDFADGGTITHRYDTSTTDLETNPRLRSGTFIKRSPILVKKEGDTSQLTRSDFTDGGTITQHYDTSTMDMETSPRLRSGTFVKRSSPILVEKEGDTRSPRDRSGTVIKRSSPVIVRKESDSDSTDDDHVSGSVIRRSGTFTKQSKPVIHKTGLSKKHSSDSEEDSDIQKSGSSPKPSTYLSTLTIPGKHNDDESTDVHDDIQEGKLRRSGTFTKDKPVVIVSRAYSEPSSSDEEFGTDVGTPYHQEVVTDDAVISTGGTEVQYESDSSFEYFEGVDLNDTLKAVDIELDEEIGNILKVSSEPDSYLKRSGTYTKRKPNLK